MSGKQIELIDESHFWRAFHAAWGKDRGNGERHSGYNKEAWMYVQVHAERNFLNIKAPGGRIDDGGIW